MNRLKKLLRSNFFIKLRNWEHWPFEIIYAPVFVYWLWLSARARSLLFFSAANPGIETGGMLGESKNLIFKLIPDRYKPVTFLNKYPTALHQVVRCMEIKGLTFPVICKPDVGERGWMVERIDDIAALEDYMERSSADFLVQEYLNLPIELGIFYFRFPDQSEGKVTSVVLKNMLKVTGDGKSTLRKLILNYDRAKLQWHILKHTFDHQLDKVLPEGEEKELVNIGNHCRGAMFLNGNHLINDQLDKVVNDMSLQINGFYYGRFDVRVASYEALYKGEVKIMELNGAGAEPAHIYHPGSSLFEAYKVLFFHWHMLYQVSKANRKRGVRYMTLKEGWRFYKSLSYR